MYFGHWVETRWTKGAAPQQPLGGEPKPAGGAMKRKGLPGEFRSNLHRGGTSEVIELTTEEKYTAILAAKAVGLGIAGVDLLQSERGPLVLEVNSSPGLEGIEKTTKTDIAGKIIAYIERNVKR